MSEPDGADIASCVGTLFTIVVTGPMWYVLMFGILSRIDSPPWLLALYWCYVPVGFLATVVLQLPKLLK